MINLCITVTPEFGINSQGSNEDPEQYINRYKKIGAHLLLVLRISSGPELCNSAWNYTKKERFTHYFDSL
jgi:hypothetical protein